MKTWILPFLTATVSLCTIAHADNYFTDADQLWPPAGERGAFAHHPRGVTGVTGTPQITAAEITTLTGTDASPRVLGEKLTALIVQNSHASRLAAHHLMDQARAMGLGEAVRKELAMAQGWNGHIEHFIEEAFPIVRPWVIAHRGGYSEIYPENTVELLKSTLLEGESDGIEIDISVTSDNVPILWHDNYPMTLVPLMRELGFEPHTPFKPHSGIHEHSIDGVSFRDVSSLYGYVAKKTHRFSECKIPTLLAALDQVGQNGQDLKIVILDIKTRSKRQDHLAAISRDVRSWVKTHKFQGTILMTHTEESGARFLRDHSEGLYQVTYESELAQPITIIPHYLGIAERNRRLGYEYLSLGSPVVSQEGWSGYLGAVRANTDYIHLSGSGQSMIAWTINDELEFRELLGTGVSVILTDDVHGMQKLLRRYELP